MGKSKAGPGRTPKLTDEIRKSILDDLATGNTQACAAARAGISARTLRRWLAAGRAGRQPFVSFLSAVKKAEQDAQAFCVRTILTASKKSWQAAAWFLERRYPAEFGNNRAELAELRRRLNELEKPSDGAAHT
jgi:transposase